MPLTRQQPEPRFGQQTPSMLVPTERQNTPVFEAHPAHIHSEFQNVDLNPPSSGLLTTSRSWLGNTSGTDGMIPDAPFSIQDGLDRDLFNPYNSFEIPDSIMADLAGIHNPPLASPVVSLHLLVAYNLAD